MYFQLSISSQFICHMIKGGYQHVSTVHFCTLKNADINTTQHTQVNMQFRTGNSMLSLHYHTVQNIKGRRTHNSVVGVIIYYQEAVPKEINIHCTQPLIIISPTAQKSTHIYITKHRNHKSTHISISPAFECS